MNRPNPVIFYDGICGLCNRSVHFIIRHDKKGIFRFATLQSQYAKDILGEKIAFDSFILYHNHKLFKRSTAAIYALSMLGLGWKLLLIAWIIPAFIRNVVYDFIATNRYKWFGKLDACPIPKPEWRDRFIMD